MKQRRVKVWPRVTVRPPPPDVHLLIDSTKDGITVKCSPTVRRPKGSDVSGWGSDVTCAGCLA